MNWPSIIVQGVLLGGLYALFAVGLSLTFGIMRVINIAHGDLIVLAAYIGFVAVKFLGIDPLLSLVVVIPVMAALGYGMQRGMLNQTLGDNILPPLLVTFGFSVIIENVLQQVFGADTRRLHIGALETASVQLPGMTVGILPVLIFVVAVGVLGALQLLFFRTDLGRAFRATSDNPVTSELMGIDNRHVYSLAMAIAMAVTAVAGIFLAIRSSFEPSMGPERLIYAFEAIIIGGLGNLWGTLLGAVILGISQSIGSAFNPQWQILGGHFAFLIVLILRPDGLFPRTRD